MYQFSSLISQNKITNQQNEGDNDLFLEYNSIDLKILLLTWSKEIKLDFRC